MMAQWLKNTGCGGQVEEIGGGDGVGTWIGMHDEERYLFSFFKIKKRRKYHMLKRNL